MLNWITRLFRLFSGGHTSTARATTSVGTAASALAGNSPAAPATTVDCDQLAVRFITTLLDAEQVDVDIEAPFEAALEQRLQRALVDFDETSLPKIAQASASLLHEIMQPDCDRKRVMDIFKQDPALAGKVVKMANSAYYAKSRVPVTSLDHALSMLGADGLRRLLMTTLVAESFDIKPIYFKLFGAGLWNHSYQVALGVEYLQQRNGNEAFAGYVCGLIHDIGKLAVFRQMLNLFAELPPDQSPQPGGLARLANRYGHRLTIRACEYWELPSDWIAPLIALQNLRPEETRQGLADSLFTANLAAELYRLDQSGLVDASELETHLAGNGIDSKTYHQLSTKFARVS